MDEFIELSSGIVWGTEPGISRMRVGLVKRWDDHTTMALIVVERNKKEKLRRAFMLLHASIHNLATLDMSSGCVYE